MTGQVKEEILTRWGELSLWMREGWAHFRPLLLDAAEIPEGGALRFTRNGVACTYRRGPATRLRVQRGGHWEDCPLARFEARGVQQVEAEIAF